MRNETARSDSRAALLRGALRQADALTHEARLTLDAHAADLLSLQETVPQITLPAQRLMVVQKGVERALAEVSFLLEQVAVPREVEEDIRRGPAGGQERFLEQLGRLEYCVACLSSQSTRETGTTSQALSAAIGLRRDALQLAAEEFRRQVAGSARVPLEHIKRAEEGDSELQASLGADDLLPAAAVARARALHEALQRNEVTASVKAYADARAAVVDSVQQAMHAGPPARDLPQMSWSAVERQAQRWAAHFSAMAGLWQAEQQLAAGVFGLQLGRVAFLRLASPWAAHVSRCARVLLEYGRPPEKMFSLLALARRVHLNLPRLSCLLPGDLLGGLERLLAGCVAEAQATFGEYCAALQGGIQRQAVGNGSVHPLAAQALGLLRRLLGSRFSARCVFVGAPEAAAPGGGEGAGQHEGAAISGGIREALDALWAALALCARACRNEALAALFLMNNAHHQLKSVQAFGQDLTVSHDWQDRCEARVEECGAQYQQLAWDPIVALLDGRASAPRGKDKASARERARAANAALERVFEQQRGWSVPDAALRGNLRDVVLEDFLPAYQEAWKECSAQAASHASGRLLRFSPEEVARIVSHELFEGRPAPTRADGSAARA